ncbi:MAG: Hsp33 family molecular chaperone HslO [Oscillospiraceae bacterium]
MDELIRMIATGAPVKAIAISGKDLVERARQIHKTLPVATAALGRTLLATSMIGSQLKNEEGSVTVRIKGDGPLGAINVVSDAQGNVRGYLQNGQIDLKLRPDGKLNVGAAVGMVGSLTVIQDLNLKEPYVGTVPLVSGEIAQDFAAYFAESEQVPTVCALGVLVDRDQSVLQAGGYLIQLLPGADEETISKIEAGVAALGPVTAALERGMDSEALLRSALEGFELELLDRRPVAYRCYCQRSRVTRALISMGADELRSLIEEEGEANLTCQFCDKVYHFTKEELESLLLGAK